MRKTCLYTLFRDITSLFNSLKHSQYAIIIISVIFIASCKKPERVIPIENIPPVVQTMNTKVYSGISMSDIMKKLPQTVMYSLGDKAKFYVEKYESFETDSTLTVRIPTSLDGNHFVYAVRNKRDMTNVNVYLVLFKPEEGSSSKNFSGTQTWLDMQNYTYYSIRYEKNTATATMTPFQIAKPNWEDCMIENGYFSLELNGSLVVNDNPVTMGGGDCHDPIGPEGHSFFKRLTDAIGEFFDNIFGGNGGSGGSSSGSTGDSSGSSSGANGGPSGSGGGYSGPGGGYGGPGGPNAGGYGGPNGSAGGNNWSPNGTIENGPAFMDENGNPVSAGVNTSAQYIVNFLNQHGQYLTQSEVNWLVFHNSPEAIAIHQYILEPSPNYTANEKAKAIKMHIIQMASNSTYSNFINEYTQNNNNWIWWTNTSWLNPHGGIPFAKWAINYLLQYPTTSMKSILENKNGFDQTQGEVLNDYTDGGYDNTIYPQSPPTSNWPEIAPVIPVNQFVGWGYAGVSMNCMDYAKAQIAKKGYQISGYFAAGQTFQIYTSQNGVNNTALIQGLSYIKYALSNGIPVIVGVDDAPGSPNTGTDNSTDHFIVIVGMGTDATGRYLQFYDNAARDVNQGAHSKNKLYYNSTSGQIRGTSQTNYAQNPGLHDYILTMIRKSKHI